METQANYSGMMNLIHHKIKHYENKSLKNNFTTQPLADYALNTVAKSTVSREKLNNLELANSSTPSNACFFVRTFCTPKENRLAVIHSMMACSGQPLGWLDFQFYPVSHPATRYRQTVRSLAIALDYLELELLAMIYKFLLLGKHRLNPITINFIHHNTKMNENNSQSTPFTKCGDFFSIFTAVAKSTASRGKLNNKTLANSSTPLNRAFFVRNFRTPKERQFKACSSMVGRNRKGFALCCVPKFAVFHPVTLYRQSVERLAVVPNKLTLELLAMIYLFKAVSRSDLRNTKKHFSAFPRYTVRINADSIKQATAQVAPYFVILGVNNV